jgi:hypothetical protein
MFRSYEYYKVRWEKTKPIRGRSTDVRPLDDSRRYRDWERIAKVSIKGQDVYACQLYDTDVVRYYPDGSIGLMIDSWATPTTAEFMHCHSPFYACKKYNQIWVYPKGHGVDECYPIPKDVEVRLIPNAEGNYSPEKPIVLTQKVVDRKKSKDARDRIKPFIDWARSFNKLTDGWIMQDTREQFAKLTVDFQHGYSRIRYDYKLPDGLLQRSWWGSVSGFDPVKTYEFLQTCDDEGYMHMYLAMCSEREKAVESKLAKVVSIESRNVELYDLQFRWEFVQRAIYKIVQDAGDVHKTIEVQATKPITGVV